MRRLLRILFNALTVLSLVLAMFVVALWVRSYQLPEDAHLSLGRGAGLGFRNKAGTLRFVASTYDPARWKNEVTTWAPTGPGEYSAPALYRVAVADNGVGGTYVASKLPHWLVLALLMAPPLIAGALRVKRRARRPAHLCRSCGYDLRATPERCPECGAVVSLGGKGGAFSLSLPDEGR